MTRPLRQKVDLTIKLGRLALHCTARLLSPDERQQAAALAVLKAIGRTPFVQAAVNGDRHG